MNNKGLVDIQLSQNARILAEKRYLQHNEQGECIETVEDMIRRVAEDVASNCKRYGDADYGERFRTYYNLIASKRFFPNSPTLMNAGTSLQQLSACFVLDVPDDMSGIYKTLHDKAMIHKSGGGTGFNFGNIRPEGDAVKSTGGIASGPLSFLSVFDASTNTVKQGGKRRGANMAVMPVNHPDILKFIRAKTVEGLYSNFNFSVMLTDAFMEAYEEGRDYELINPRTGAVVGKLNAKDVMDEIIEGAWRNGEPGILFGDEINRHNTVPDLGRITATNPCGEQPLLPNESCNLGSINLVKHVWRNPYTSEFEIDWETLEQTVRDAVSFLDDVIDRNQYPTEAIREATLRTRKIGLGVMGWADTLILLGIPYDSEEALELAEEVMRFINVTGHHRSRELAKSRGNFPAWSESVYDEPMRNATITTIAPTGSISIMAGVSPSIEPLFGIAFVRNVLDGEQLVEVNPYFKKIAVERGFYSEELLEKIANNGRSCQGLPEVPEDVQRLFKTAHDISPLDHIRMQAAFQKYTDNAVSKTINFPNSATKDDVREAYELAYRLGCKGLTVYRDGSRMTQVITATTTSKSAEEKEETKPIKVQGIRPKPVLEDAPSRRIKLHTGCGTMYLHLVFDEDGEIAEIFTTADNGGCVSNTVGVSRMVSLALRSGIDKRDIIRQLREVPTCISFNRCASRHPDKCKGRSCPDAIGRVLQRYMGYSDAEIKGKVDCPIVTKLPRTEEEKQRWKDARKQELMELSKDVCPECGVTLMNDGGCTACPNPDCGFSKCG